MWTPMYGKYQLRTGSLVYFDTFISGGGGMVGVREKYEHCNESSRPESTVFEYSYFEVGFGQRFFLSKDDSLRWDIKSPMFFSNTADSSCGGDANGSRIFNQNIHLQMGYSRFF